MGSNVETIIEKQELFEFQKKAFDSAVESINECNQAAIEMFTDAGKTYIAKALISYFYRRAKQENKKFNAIWVSKASANTNAELKFINKFNEEHKEKDANGKDVDVIRTVGLEKLSRAHSSDINISDITTLFSNTDMIVFDESHQAVAENRIALYKDYIEKNLKDNCIIVAMSATPIRSSDGKNSFKLLTPKVKNPYVYDDKQAHKDGVINPLHIIDASNIFTDTEQQKREIDNLISLAETYQEVGVKLHLQELKEARRNSFIMDTRVFNLLNTTLGDVSVRFEGERHMFFFNRIDKVKEAEKTIMGALRNYYGSKWKINLYTVTAETSKDETDRVIKKLVSDPEDYTVDAVVAAYKLTESIHPKNIRTVHLIDGTSSNIRFEQTKGRGMTLANVDTDNQLTYFIDYKGSSNLIGKPTIYVGKRRLKDRTGIVLFDGIDYTDITSDDMCNSLADVRDRLMNNLMSNNFNHLKEKYIKEHNITRNNLTNEQMNEIYNDLINNYTYYLSDDTVNASLAEEMLRNSISANEMMHIIVDIVKEKKNKGYNLYVELCKRVNEKVKAETSNTKKKVLENIPTTYKKYRYTFINGVYIPEYCNELFNKLSEKIEEFLYYPLEDKALDNTKETTHSILRIRDKLKANKTLTDKDILMLNRLEIMQLSGTITSIEANIINNNEILRDAIKAYSSSINIDDMFRIAKLRKDSDTNKKKQEYRGLVAIMQGLGNKSWEEKKAKVLELGKINESRASIMFVRLIERDYPEINVLTGHNYSAEMAYKVCRLCNEKIKIEKKNDELKTLTNTSRQFATNLVKAGEAVLDDVSKYILHDYFEETVGKSSIERLRDFVENNSEYSELINKALSGDKEALIAVNSKISIETLTDRQREKINKLNDKVIKNTDSIDSSNLKAVIRQALIMVNDDTKIKDGIEKISYFLKNNIKCSTIVSSMFDGSMSDKIEQWIEMGMLYDENQLTIREDRVTDSNIKRDDTLIAKYIKSHIGTDDSNWRFKVLHKLSFEDTQLASIFSTFVKISKAVNKVPTFNSNQSKRYSTPYRGSYSSYSRLSRTTKY